MNGRPEKEVPLSAYFGFLEVIAFANAFAFCLGAIVVFEATEAKRYENSERMAWWALATIVLLAVGLSATVS